MLAEQARSGAPLISVVLPLTVAWGTTPGWIRAMRRVDPFQGYLAEGLPSP